MHLSPVTDHAKAPCHACQVANCFAIVQATAEEIRGLFAYMPQLASGSEYAKDWVRFVSTLGDILLYVYEILFPPQELPRSHSSSISTFMPPRVQ